MKKPLVLIISLFLSVACQAQEENNSKQYRSFGRCDGCDAVFEYGYKKLNNVDTLPDFNKYESKIKLTGTVFQPDGKTPAPDIILYIYHTNPEGRYPKKGDETGWAKMHGYVRGWVKTDSNGKYTFYTFQPGSYGSGAAHIHAAVLEPDGKYYYIDDYNFKDDPYLNKEAETRNWGGSGIVKLRKDKGLMTAERNIVLGLNIPGYE